MKLAIVSHTPHHRDDAGELRGWGATVREIDQLASLFTSVVHVAPVHPGKPPENALPYRAPNLRVLPVRPAGGRDLSAKAGIVAATPGYLGAIRQALRGADAVHVRLPSNIGALALLALMVRREPASRWFKYAGNWRPEPSGPARREPTSYALQRSLLSRGWARGAVTVNGDWPAQPAHVLSFPNPCLTEAELAGARESAAAKVQSAPTRLLFVGRLHRDKGVREAVAAWTDLATDLPELELDLVGDGPARPELEALTSDSAGRVRLHGWLPRADLDRLYQGAHLILHPSYTEGWPKVLGEAMAFGVVPIASAVSCLPQVLSEGPSGTTVPVQDVAALAGAVRAYVEAPERWRRHSRAATELAASFTYTSYLERVRRLFAERWGDELAGPGERPS